MLIGLPGTQHHCRAHGSNPLVALLLLRWLLRKMQQMLLLPVKRSVLPCCKMQQPNTWLLRKMQQMLLLPVKRSVLPCCLLKTAAKHLT
jgi:hypothetical protein